MSITRTAWTDDDGSGTTGTVINNAIKTGLYDEIDARWSRASITSTGTQNNLDISEADLVILNNASLLTITGIVAPASPVKPGKRLILVSTGAGQVDLSHQSGSSTAANRMINFATSASTSLAAGSGAAVYVYDDANSRWRLVSHTQGAYITPTFAAGDYTASTGSWTVDSGDVTTCAYLLEGRKLTVAWVISGTDVSATPTSLQRAIPGGFTSALTATHSCHATDAGGTQESGSLVVTASGTLLLFRLQDGTAWATTSSDNTGTSGTANISVT